MNIYFYALYNKNLVKNRNYKVLGKTIKISFIFNSSDLSPVVLVLLSETHLLTCVQFMGSFLNSIYDFYFLNYIVILYFIIYVKGHL